jgi:hypothetical protein
MMNRGFAVALAFLFYAESVMAGVASFNTGNYLSRNAAVLTTYPFFVSAWGFIPSLDANNRVGVSIGIGSGDNVHNLMLYSADVFGVKARDTAASDALDGAPPTGAWFHMAGSFVSTTRREASVNAGTKAVSTTSRIPTTPDQIHIGTQSNVAANWGSGSTTRGLAEISAWNCCAVEADRDALIAKLANGQNPINVDNEAGQAWRGTLVAYWPLTDTTDLTDATGNGHDLSETGTLTNHASHPDIEPVSAGNDARRIIVVQ